MSRKKKRYTVVQPFTPFERSKTKDIQELIERDGINPLTVVSVGIGGARGYRTEDICNYFELTGTSFDVTHSVLKRKKKGDSYVRTTTEPLRQRAPKTNGS